MTTHPSHIWYACYGSNLSAERFHKYLRGGAVPGGTDAQVGARDASAPTGEATLLTSWELTYGHYSERWGGGAAFLVEPASRAETPRSPAEAVERGSMCRLYRLTCEQFLDVWLQENGGDPRSDTSALAELEATMTSMQAEVGKHIVHAPRIGAPSTGWYQRLICLGERHGEWVLSFTSDAELPFVAPSSSYLATIKRGLAEAFGAMTSDQIEAYVARRASGVEHRSL